MIRHATGQPRNRARSHAPASVQVAVLILAACAPFFGVVRPAYACSCAATTVPQATAASSEVFLGRVKELTTRSDGQVAATFAVTAVWKGDPPPDQVVVTPRDEATCGVTFKPSTDYVVFASERDGSLSTTICSRTGEAAQLQDVIAELGDPIRATFSEPLPQKPRALPRRTAAAAIGIAVLVGVAGWAFIMRRSDPTAGKPQDGDRDTP